jgi:hypothetical protein
LKGLKMSYADVDRAFWRALPAYQSGDDDEIAPARKEYDRQLKAAIEAGVWPFGNRKDGDVWAAPGRSSQRALGGSLTYQGSRHLSRPKI